MLLRNLRWVDQSFVALALALVVARPSIAQSQGALTLSEAERELTQNSPRLERAESVKSEASWRKAEAIGAFLPVVTASANYIFAKKYLYTDINLGAPASIPQIVPTSLFSINAQWLIFDGLANVDRFRAVGSLEDSAQNELEWARFQSEREVALVFYKALAAKQLREVAEQNLRTIEDHLKDVNSFRRAGLSTKYDALRVEVQQSEAQSEMLNATDNVEISKGKLAELLGKEREDRELAGRLPVLSEELLKKLDPSKSERRKDLVSLEQKAHALALQESATSRFWVPKVGLYAQYQYYNNRDDSLTDWSQFRNAYQFGLNLSWNIFDGLGSYARTRQSVEQRTQAEKALRMSELKARQDFETFKRKFAYFCAVYRSKSGDVEKATESVRLAREGRKVGSRTNTELLDAETELFRARASVVNAQVGAVEALINLELSTGQKLYDFN